MVNTNEEWTWNEIKKLVKQLDLQVNDVKQMWSEIDTDESVDEKDRDFAKCMPEYMREMRFGN
jgi:hypothetical protein